MAKTKSKNTFHKFNIVQRKNSGGVMTGANTTIKMDGKALTGVTSVSFKVNAVGVAKIQIEFIGQVEIDGIMEND